jgi:crossover junction endodeoxyribonuclease RuvC
MQEEQIILGVDPGTTIMGFGIIAINKNSMRMIQMHELHLKKYDNHFLKLHHIFKRTIELIDEYNPDEMALEAPFFWKKCAVHAQIRKSSRSCHGSRFI